MNLPRKVLICEVGPRDGLQNEKVFIETGQKVELINRAAAAGLALIEIGSFVHPKAIPQLRDMDDVAKQIAKKEGVEYRALVLNLKGAERAIAAGVPKIKLTLSATESHNRSNLNNSIAGSLEGFGACLALAREHGIPVSGAISVAFGCPFEGEVPERQIIYIARELITLGIREISLADTTGMANPSQVYSRVSAILDRFPDITWNLHLHNTRGMALANIVMAMQAGITRFDASFAGLGGCPYAPGASGNVATEDLVHMCREMGIDTGIDLDKMIDLARYVRDLVGHETDSFVLKAGKCSDLAGYRPKGQIKAG